MGRCRSGPSAQHNHHLPVRLITVSLALDATVSLDTPNYDLDGNQVSATFNGGGTFTASGVASGAAPPTPSSGGGIVRKPVLLTIRGTCWFNGGGTFTISQARTHRGEADSDALLLLI